MTARAGWPSFGCGLALDDFGTGYATLSYLKHLPISSIKMDREFIEHLTTDPRDQRIVEALVGIARAADPEDRGRGRRVTPNRWSCCAAWASTARKATSSGVRRLPCAGSPA